MDRRTDRNNLGRKSTPSLERMDRWTDGQIEIYRLESLPPLLKELSDGQIKIIWHETLLTAEDIWFKCDLYLQFIPPITLWKICIDLRPFSKCFCVPFSRTLRSNNLEIQNDKNSKWKLVKTRWNPKFGLGNLENDLLTSMTSATSTTSKTALPYISKIASNQCKSSKD